MVHGDGDADSERYRAAQVGAVGVDRGENHEDEDEAFNALDSETLETVNNRVSLQINQT